MILFIQHSMDRKEWMVRDFSDSLFSGGIKASMSVKVIELEWRHFSLKYSFLKLNILYQFKTITCFIFLKKVFTLKSKLVSYLRELKGFRSCRKSYIVNNRNVYKYLLVFLIPLPPFQIEFFYFLPAELWFCEFSQFLRLVLWFTAH